MLKIRDALKLSHTKLKSHRIWSAVVIILNAILLSCLFLLIAFGSGTKASLDAFNSQGLNGRYLVTATNLRWDPAILKDTAVWDLADQLYAQYTTEHARIAAEIGFNYSPNSEDKPTEYIQGERTFKGLSNPYGKLAIQQSIGDRGYASLSDLKSILSNYPYKQIYTVNTLNVNGTLAPIKDTEDYSSYADAAGPQNTMFPYFSVIDSSLYDYYLFDSSKNYLSTDDGTVPVVLPLSQIQNYLGIEISAQNESERLTQLEKIYAASENLVIEACYRNNASRQLIFQAVSAAREAEYNQDNPDYSSPNLIYGLPNENCGAVTIIKDTRSDEQKTAAALQEEYQRRIGGYEAPVQHLFRFKVVGIIDDSKSSSSISKQNLAELFKSLGGISLTLPIIPRDYYTIHQSELDAIAVSPEDEFDYYGGSYEHFIVEFNDAATASSFIAQEGCQNTSGNCLDQNKPFAISEQINNSIIINDISQLLTQIILWAILIVMLFLILSIGKTIARSIASDRREIAIFRAIGLSRKDIALVYLSYSFILAGIIIVLAITLSLIIGFAINPSLSNTATDFLRATFFNIKDPLTANLFAPQPLYILAVALITVFFALLSALPPIFINSRRNIVDGLKYE